MSDFAICFYSFSCNKYTHQIHNKTGLGGWKKTRRTLKFKKEKKRQFCTFCWKYNFTWFEKLKLPMLPRRTQVKLLLDSKQEFY